MLVSRRGRLTWYPVARGLLVVLLVPVDDARWRGWLEGRTADPPA